MASKAAVVAARHEPAQARGNRLALVVRSPSGPLLMVKSLVPVAAAAVVRAMPAGGRWVMAVAVVAERPLHWEGRV